MAADATTFFWAFTAVFGLLAYYLWHLDRRAHRLQERVAALEAATRPAAGEGSDRGGPGAGAGSAEAGRGPDATGAHRDGPGDEPGTTSKKNQDDQP